MDTPEMDALEQNIVDLEGKTDALIAYVIGSREREAAKDAEIARLVDAASINATEKAALQGRIANAVAKSQAIEDKAAAAIPGLPPVGESATLKASYASRADFDAAVAAYKGAEGVDVDGAEVKAASDDTLPRAAYYTHSADGSVSTSGPTD